MSTELSDAVVRLKQLAYLCTASAGRGPQLARELTALAPEAVLDSATRVAGEIRRRRWSGAPRPDEPLSTAQHTALHEIARGHVVVAGSTDRSCVHHRTTRVLISTLRSLEALPLAQARGTYARVLRADHARRSLRLHAERLAQTAVDATLPHRAKATVQQADALPRFLDGLSGRFTPRPGSLPRTSLPPAPARDTSEEPSTRNAS
ncbi:hypothetical protein [Streptomyces sp. NPDC018584]|uniref:hypothetical protein n=1 Tax=unclassified Streptomyces TaxID=2593676 RepID=UPI0037AB036D